MRDAGGHAVQGRYDLEGELGRGAGGVVYSARDRTDGRTVAIKLGHPHAAHAGATIRSDLIHEYLVTVHERGTHDDLAYVVMEHVDGSDLTAYCTTETRLPLDVMLSVMTRVARALAFLHEHGIVHGDVKPANVLYGTRGDVVKLGDLSAGCAAGAAASGTPAYLAPEQVCGRPPSAAADQFAFGVTLYELACGALPFSGASLPQLLFAIAHEKHADVRSHDATLPEALAAVIGRALEKEPAARFESMSELAAALENLCALNVRGRSAQR